MQAKCIDVIDKDARWNQIGILLGHSPSQDIAVQRSNCLSAPSWQGARSYTPTIIIIGYLPPPKLLKLHPEK